MLIKHLRTSCNNRPYATIVAIDELNIGVAICSGQRHSPNKKMMVAIAHGRATKNPYHLGNTKVPNINVAFKLEDENIAIVPMKLVIDNEVSKIRERMQSVVEMG